MLERINSTFFSFNCRVIDNGQETVTVEEDGVLKSRTVNGVQQALTHWLLEKEFVVADNLIFTMWSTLWHVQHGIVKAYGCLRMLWLINISHNYCIQFMSSMLQNHFAASNALVMDDTDVSSCVSLGQSIGATFKFCIITFWLKYIVFCCCLLFLLSWRLFNLKLVCLVLHKFNFTKSADDTLLGAWRNWLTKGLCAYILCIVLFLFEWLKWTEIYDFVQ